MKFLVISMIIFSVFVIPTAFAESSPYILVQVIHRDSDGNLLAYLQSDYMNSVNLPALNYLLDYESSRNQDPIYENDGKQLQVINRMQSAETFESDDLIGKTELYVDMNGIEVLAVQFLHDGFRMISGDTITTVWNFARFV